MITASSLEALRSYGDSGTRTNLHLPDQAVFQDEAMPYMLVSRRVAVRSTYNQMHIDQDQPTVLRVEGTGATFGLSLARRSAL